MLQMRIKSLRNRGHFTRRTLYEIEPLKITFKSTFLSALKVCVELTLLLDHWRPYVVHVPFADAAVLFFQTQKVQLTAAAMAAQWAMN